MKKLLILITLSAITTISFAQNVKKCATQDKLDKLIQEDPSILQKLKENREKNTEWIKLTKNNTKDSNYSYPAIPGFTPTGNLQQDKINFQNAKSQLKGEDIEKCRIIIRDHKKKLYEEMLKKQKQNQESKTNKND